MNHRRRLNGKKAARRKKDQRRVSNADNLAKATFSLIKVSSRRFSFLWRFKYQMEKTCKKFLDFSFMVLVLGAVSE